MDNNALKSRREFFKKVINGTLPFLGIFTFLNIPVTIQR